MTALADNLEAFELHAPGDVEQNHGAALRLTLRATEDGWSLMTHDGVVAFRGFGTVSRRQCLQHARDLGVLVVLG